MEEGVPGPHHRAAFHRCNF